MITPMIPQEKMKILHKGVVIPAVPLVLNDKRTLDEQRQRALLRYYLDAGAGGIAVGVHTTQFEIRHPEHNLLERILTIASEEVDSFSRNTGKPILKIAGVIGETEQAVQESTLAHSLGYDAALLGLAAFRNKSNEEMVAHSRKIGGILPLFGFYLQPAVGGRLLDVHFWRAFSAIENVVAIKIAPFNRYHTYDVVRGVAESGRAKEIALYTGNDDNIIADLLTEYQVTVGTDIIRKRIVGGLLGHWAVWTRKAVEYLDKVHAVGSSADLQSLLALGVKVTDANAAFFDVANNFAGVIPGIHEVLHRQGLMEGTWTLNPKEVLSPGQMEEIDRVYRSYPELNDDDFVKANLDRWLNSPV